MFLSEESTDRVYQVSTVVHHDAVTYADGGACMQMVVHGLYSHMSLGKGLVSYSHKPIPLTGVR